ncbi:MAG: hypothetical protein ACTHU0_14720 [Kofleriaceae bacterium]
MSFGLVEVVTLLLGLSNFGLQQNPKPPTPDASLQYAMPDADIVVQLDATSVVPGNYKALLALKDQPQIKASPELSKIVRTTIGDIDGGRGLIKTMTGIDLTTDVSDATVFIQLVPNGQPNFIASVRGKFSPASIDKIAKVSGKQSQRIGSAVLAEVGTTEPSIALTGDGVLLAGTPKLVRDRLAPSWKAPARAPGSMLANAADVINGKPIFAMMFAMSPAARKLIAQELGAQKNVATDAIQRHKFAALSLHHDGLGLTWIDTSRAGLDAMAQMTEGTLDLLRAAQVAPRGFTKLALGAIESYRGTSKELDEVIRRKADVMKLVESYTGDGNFRVKLDKNPASLRLDMRATGKTLSEVLPTGAFVPLALLGMVRMEAAPPPSSTIAAPPPATHPVRPAPRPKAPAPAPQPRR